MRLADSCLLIALLTGLFVPRAEGESKGDAQHLFQKALDAQKHGDYDTAIRTYRELVKTSPKLLPAWVNLGVTLVQAGNFPEAIQSYETALALEPTNRRIQFYLGLAYFKSGDAPAASRQFEGLLRSDPNDFHAATLLAASDLQSGENARALAVLEPLSDAARDDSDFLWSLATAQIANGKFREGTASAEKVAHQTNSAEAWKLAGENLLRLNEFPRAKDDMESAARANPNLPGLQSLLGQAREKNADYDGAIAAFRKAVEQNPQDFGAWLNLGSDQYFIRDLSGARISLGRALAINPESAPANYALALVDKGQGNPAAAIVELEHAVKILPSWIEAHIQLAALYMQARRTVEGTRERELVDKLTDDERKSGPAKY